MVPTLVCDECGSWWLSAPDGGCIAITFPIGQEAYQVCTQVAANLRLSLEVK